MNKDRRKKLDALQDRITALKADLETSFATAREIHGELEAIRDEEQEAFDNLSEGLQQAERGQDMEAAVSSMDEALSKLDELADAFDSDEFDEAFASIEEAKGQA